MLARKIRFIFPLILVMIILSLIITYAFQDNTNSQNVISFSQATKQYSQFPWRQFTEAVQSSKLNNKDFAIEILLLKGGFSSDALFKVNLSGKNYVLRFMGNHHNLEQRRIISTSFEWAGMNGFGPKNYLIDQDHYSYILSEFLKGRTLNLKDTKNKKILESIGTILSKVHQTEPPKRNYQEFSQFIFGQKWYQTAAVD